MGLASVPLAVPAFATPPAIGTPSAIGTPLAIGTPSALADAPSVPVMNMLRPLQLVLAARGA